MSGFPQSLDESFTERDYIRLVCLSDTHGLHDSISEEIPEGEILVHCGDFTNTGEREQIESFLRWMSGQPHRYKVLIAGNHDITLQVDYYNSFGKSNFHKHRVVNYDPEECRSLVQNYPGIIYLEDSGKELVFDDAITPVTIKVYGTPWQPEFCDWAFNLPR
jgi:calcineurin-like phosphoesterase family protein